MLPPGNVGTHVYGTAPLDAKRDEELMSDESSENTGGATEAELPDVADFEALLDMRAPQPGYRTAIEQGGLLEPMEGFKITFSRELTDYVLRHHELFSSNSGLDLGNIR